MNPKISVITIGYNVEPYIKQCLTSLLRQQYDNYEVIYVDDGSKDNSAKIAKDLASQHANMIVVEKENGGIISAKIEGVRRATGDYLCFVDGDDWAGTEYLSELSAGIRIQGVPADIVAGKHFVQKADGTFFKSGCSLSKNVLTGDEYFREIMEDHIDHYTVAKLFHRVFFLNAGYLDFPHVTMAEDLLTNALLGLNKPRVHFLDCAGYYYRYTETSLTRAGDERLLEQGKTLSYMEKQILQTDTYRDLMSYQWFSYLQTYLQARQVPTHIKRMLVEICKKPIHGWTHNQYSVKRWQRLTLNGKIRMCIYIYLPAFISPYEYLLFCAYKLRAGKKLKHNICL